MKHCQKIGTSFDDFLAEEGELEEATAVAIKRVISWQIGQAMKETGTTKSALARKMKTSRTVVDRVLDGADASLTLDTLTRAATALGRRIKIDLVVA